LRSGDTLLTIRTGNFAYDFSYFGRIDALKVEIEHWVALGELLSLDIETIGISSLAGKYEADPTL
jgi:hypothetical protein